MGYKRDIVHRKQGPNPLFMHYFGFEIKDLTIPSHLPLPLLTFVFKTGPKYKTAVLHNFTAV